MKEISVDSTAHYQALISEFYGREVSAEEVRVFLLEFEEFLDDLERERQCHE